MRKQYVSIIGNRITSLQSQGNPGIYKTLQMNANTKYRIILKGFKQLRGELILWISQINNKSLINIPIKNPEKIFYKNGNRKKVKVGITFKNAKVNNTFLLDDINIASISKIRKIQRKGKKKIIRKKKRLIKRMNIKTTQNTIGDILSKYFDHIYILNLDKDKQRMQRISKIFNDLGIKYERFRGIYGGNYLKEFARLKKQKWSQWERRQTVSTMKVPGAYGCLLSHRAIIKDAIQKKYKKILVFEDDVAPHKNLKHMLIKASHVLKMNWKLIYLGSTQHNWMDIGIMNRYYKANKTDSTYAYGIDSSIFQEMLNITKFPKYPVDVYYRYFQNKYLCPVLYPQLFIARLDHSNIRGGRNIIKFARQFRWQIKNYMLR